MDVLELPVRHGEGKIVAPDDVMNAIRDQHLAPLSYIDPATGEATETWPLNPNGSRYGLAALTDPTGRLFGLMPHPEAFLHRTNHPRWTREERPDEGDGLILFSNAVNYIRGNF
jgi:phosphoribosylformylglycinamidine synthase